jgi:hypothetical protein
MARRWDAKMGSYFCAVPNTTATLFPRPNLGPSEGAVGVVEGRPLDKNGGLRGRYPARVDRKSSGSPRSGQTASSRAEPTARSPGRQPRCPRKCRCRTRERPTQESLPCPLGKLVAIEDQVHGRKGAVIDFVFVVIHLRFPLSFHPANVWANRAGGRIQH